MSIFIFSRFICSVRWMSVAAINASHVPIFCVVFRCRFVSQQILKCEPGQAHEPIDRGPIFQNMTNENTIEM